MHSPCLEELTNVNIGYQTGKEKKKKKKKRKKSPEVITKTLNN